LPIANLGKPPLELGHVSRYTFGSPRDETLGWVPSRTGFMRKLALAKHLS